MSALAALGKAQTDLEVELALTLAMCEVVDTPHSLAISLLLRNKEYIQLKTLPLFHELYLDGKVNPYLGDEGFLWPTVTQYKDDRQVSRMMLKSSCLVVDDVNPKEEAKKVFLEIETLLENQTSERVSTKGAPWLLAFTKEIYLLLAKNPNRLVPFSPDHLQKIVDRGRLGPGRSAGMRVTRQSDKLSEVSSVGPDLEPMAVAIKGPVWTTRQSKTVVVSVAKVSTVPKNTWVDRTIVAMPVVDMYLQLGLGDEIADILRLNGVDIKDQSRNQMLAQAAYSQALATIDLSSASSWFTLRNLEGFLPPELYHLCDLVRPKQWCFSDEVVDDMEPTVRPMYNWLPMGAGHTFALQTLYYFALARITVPRSQHHQVSVYGDDIIVPAAYAQEMICRLEHLGFKVNRLKSFIEGNFHESCGHDYLYETNVTPFYCRKAVEFEDRLENQPVPTVSYRIALANKLRNWAKIGSGSDARFKAIWERLIQPVARKERPVVPPHFGDCGLIGCHEETNYAPYQEYLDRGYDGVWYNIAYMHFVPKALDPSSHIDLEQSPESYGRLAKDKALYAMMLWTMRHGQVPETPKEPTAEDFIQKYGEENYRCWMEDFYLEKDLRQVRKDRNKTVPTHLLALAEIEKERMRQMALEFLTSWKEPQKRTFGAEVDKDSCGSVKLSYTPTQWDDVSTRWVRTIPNKGSLPYRSSYCLKVHAPTVRSRASLYLGELVTRDLVGAHVKITCFNI